MHARPGRTFTIALQDNGIPLHVEISKTDRAGNQFTEVMLAFDRDASQITLQVFQPKPSGTAVLCLSLDYLPEYPLAPIHLDTKQFSSEISRFYADTWVDNSDSPAAFKDITSGIQAISTSGLVITEDCLHDFCNLISSSSKWYVSKNSAGVSLAPIDFAVISATSNILHVTSSSLFAGGQLNVVQLFNQMQLVNGSGMLAVGDHIRSDLFIDKIVNIPIGRQIKVNCTCYSNDKPVAIVKCALVSLNNPASHDITFRNAFGLWFTLVYKSAAEVTVLETKAWFYYLDSTDIHLSPMAEVEFVIDSKYMFMSDSTYSSISTTGQVFLKWRHGNPVYIANVDFQWGKAAADPVVEYLKRHSIDSRTVLFDDGGYTLVPLAGQNQMVTLAPVCNNETACITGDYNPIHTNPYVADLAGLPDTITHGLWTSSAIRAVVESCVADNQPKCMCLFRTDFVGMVLPGDKLNTKIQHVGMADGLMLVNSETFNEQGDIVLKCSAEIEQPVTAYVFTGQGSQTVGMGMDLYAESEAARNVWDHADEHMQTKYGISILDIVHRNLKSLTLYFGRETGQSILANYMSLTCNSCDKSKKMVPLFPEITADSESFTFSAPNGLLNATQFTQVTLVIFSIASVADMQSKQLIQKEAVFAGHSLGEYCALATLTDIFTLEDVIDIVFYCGLVMQSAVEHDYLGNLQYGMVAVNLS
ncbi:fatty acid synthase alpha subunit Lsd1 [Coemansia erecta]|nr:fatty acid synthase alpha subunit Lsd1 [Coemansia erecta]